MASNYNEVRGLINLGNKCYFNSILQPLYHTYALYEELFDTNGGKLRNSLIRVFLEMQDKSEMPVDPFELCEQLKKRVQRFNNYGQHDSHECLRHLLDEIRKEERASKSETEESSSGNGSLTAVDKIFGGHSITVFICKACDRHYHIFEPCLDISVPVFFEAEKENAEASTSKKLGMNEHQNPRQSTETDSESVKHRKESQAKYKYEEQREDKNEIDYKQRLKRLMTPLNSNTTTLDDCLRHFSRKEQFDKEYLCEDCLEAAKAKEEALVDNLKLTTATKRTLIFNPPAILIIHFKRFELLPGGSKKRSDMVKYPEHLDLAPYCSSQCLRNEPQRNNIWYSLYAVVVHSGSLDSGHYVAYVKVREREENVKKLKEFLQHKNFNHNVTVDDLKKIVPLKKEPKKTETKSPRKDESKWYLFNDRYVHEVEVEEVLEQEAYLLFYEQVKGLG